MSTAQVSKFENDVAKEMFGRKLSTALALNYCVSCGPEKKVLKSKVGDVAFASWKKDGLCPACNRTLD